MAHIPYAAYQRPRLRLAPHDYSGGGVYFITVSTFDRRPLFGEIEAPDRTRLSALGVVVEETWRSLPKRYPHVEIDACIVMPEHFHGLIALSQASLGEQKQKPLGSVIGAFKSMVTNAAKHVDPSLQNEVWQSNFYDRIVRGGRELGHIRQYIFENPARRWARMDRI